MSEGTILFMSAPGQNYQLAIEALTGGDGEEKGVHGLLKLICLQVTLFPKNL